MSRFAGRGMTLIEVLTALVIISVMLGGIVAARSRLVDQWVRAERTLEAVEAADDLLTHWQRSGAIPHHGRGQLGEAMVWRTLRVPTRELEATEAEVVRFEVWADDALAGEPLLVVEVLRAAPRQKGGGA